MSKSMKGAVQALAIAGLLALAGAAHATPAVGTSFPIVLSDADEVTLTPTGRVQTVTRTTAQPEAPPADRTATEETMSPSQPATMTTSPGTVRFVLWTNPRDGARLKFENNSSRPLIFSAELVIRGRPRPEPTTICSVLPGRVGYELWPDNITAIRITGFYPAPASGQVCGNPENGDLGAPPPNAAAPSGGK